MVTSIQLGTLFQSGGKNVIGGTSSGIDSKSLIEDLVKAKRIPATKLEDKIKVNESRAKAFSELQSILGRFKDAANFLRNPPGVGNAADDVFKFRKVDVVSNSAISGSSYFTASALPGTEPRSYQIDNITSLARATKQESNVFAVADTNTAVVQAVPGAGQLGAGTITINGQNVTLVAGDTLAGVASKFNAVKSQTGVSFTTLQVSPGNFKLIATATDSGLSNAFDLENVATVSADTNVFTNVTFSTTQAASNAQFDVDGVTITRETNKISDLVDGVTIDLKQTTNAAPATQLDLQIIPDDELVKTGIKNFLDTYNEFRLFFARQTEKNSDGSYTEKAVLGSNSTLNSTLNQIGAELAHVVSGVGGGIDRLGAIGVAYGDFPGDDETPATRNIITLNEEKLDAALTTDFEGVRKLFQFDFTSTSTKLGVFSRTNSLGVSNFTLNVNTATSSYLATYDPGTGPVTVGFNSTALGTGGATLRGIEGTPFEGLVLIYAGTGTESINVTTTQGVGDRLFNTLDQIVKTGTGLIAQELTALDAADTRYQDEIDRIDRQIESYRQSLLDKFGALDSAITSVNTLLQTLDAQTQARNNS